MSIKNISSETELPLLTLLLKVFIYPGTVIIFSFLLSNFLSCKSKESELNKKNNELYLRGLQPNKDVNNVFNPEGQVSLCDTILSLPGYPESEKQNVLYLKAVNLLYLGRENEAIQILKGIMGKNLINDQPGLMNNVRKYLALAYQRLGERNNCISNHSSGSCIFPIQGKGIYSDTMASSSSIKIYEEILKQNPNDLESKWLLNLVFMTLGQYPQKVPSGFLIPGLDKDPSSYHVKSFENIAAGLNLNHFRNMAGGSIVDDFNNDNYLDVITSAWGLDEGMHYFKNNGDGSFTDVSRESGLSNIKGGLNIMQADYNNDGYTDVLILRGAWWGEFGKQPNTLLKNNGDGTFSDVTVESRILSFHPTQTATWADFNNDGWLDLFIGNETVSQEYPHPCELYINNQNGTFTEEAAASGCQIIGFTKGVTSGDYNNDGWTDIFISDLTGKKRLLKNKGLNSKIPEFTDITHEAGLDKDPSSTFPTWFWDYNNDGWPDIFICGYQYNGSLGIAAAAEALKLPAQNPSRMYLYRNNHDGTFSDVSVSAGLNKAVFAMGSNFGDIDNDGWLDMYLGTGNPDLKSLIPNRLFKNIGGEKFADVTYSSRMGNLQKGHGVSFADIDNDGDLDIFNEVGGAVKGDAYFNSLYINPGQDDNNFIGLILEGVASNRSAIGARISVSFIDSGVSRTVFRDVNSGGSFGSSPLRQEIGIGKAKRVDRIIIKWPNTKKPTVLKNLTGNIFLKIIEGKDEVKIINLQLLKFKINYAPMHNM